MNPSGRLPITFPRAVGQIPIYYNHKNTGRPRIGSDTAKYHSRYIDVPNTPRWPFGFGLSYTTFGYRDLKVANARLGQNDTLKVTATVANTGSRAGETVVQLYVHDEVASVTRPVRELKGFRRVALAPGESKAVDFRVPVSQLAFWGLDRRFVVEPGTFRVFVGPNSIEGLEGRFEVIH